MKTASLYNIYDKKIYPSIKSVRGSTRIASILEKQVLKKFEPGFKVRDQQDLIYFLKEKEMIEKFVETVSENQYFLDVGGYHGFYSLIAGGEGAEVDCFEIDPGNTSVIRENIGLNPEMDVRVYEKAVWSEETEICVETGNEGENKVDRGSGRVEAVCLDSFVDRCVDVIKIDVEGAELQVLKGAEKILDKHRPVLFLEIHSENVLQQFGSTRSELVEFLDSKGYDLQKICGKGREELVLAR